MKFPKIALEVFLLSLLLFTAVFAEEGLLYKSSMTYLGAFRMPNDEAGLGGSSFIWGGHGLAPYHDPVSGKSTLFLEGHAWYPGFVAQVEIPGSVVDSPIWDDLPMATVLQNFYDILDGQAATLTTDDTGFFVYGMFPYNGRLIVGASEYYGADDSQVNSHGVSGFNLSIPDDFLGFYPMAAAANPRGLGGYMTSIPTNWQTPFGGPAFTGNCCIPGVAMTSAGPAASVFDPDDVGVEIPIPASTVLFYTLEHPLAPDTGTNALYNLATQMGGMAFPQGSRSILFVGRQGTGTYCYGCGINPGDPCTEDCGLGCCVDPCHLTEGTHAYPYTHQVWAYDADHLVAVKNGLSQHWEPQPYATWTLEDMDTSGCARITSAAYDASTRRLYITQEYEDLPRVDVYEIGSQTDIADPARIADPVPRYYNTLNAAYGGLMESGKIQARELSFVEDWVLAKSYAVTFEGGYNATYTAATGRTMMEGKLTISSGSLTVEGLDIR